MKGRVTEREREREYQRLSQHANIVNQNEWLEAQVFGFCFVFFFFFPCFCPVFLGENKEVPRQNIIAQAEIEEQRTRASDP